MESVPCVIKSHRPKGEQSNCTDMRLLAVVVKKKGNFDCSHRHSGKVQDSLLSGPDVTGVDQGRTDGGDPFPAFCKPITAQRARVGPQDGYPSTQS